MRIFLAGKWVEKQQKIEVRNPYDTSVIDTVPKADKNDVERALSFAEQGAKVIAKLSGYERWRILRKAADLMAARNEELGRLISTEEGKILAEGRFEANRAVETMMGSAEEAKRIHGETVPLDGDPGGGKKIGFTLRVPCGVVVAISPFNFPLNLVCHKVGPALAAGNSVIIKPATDTPLSALKLTDLPEPEPSHILTPGRGVVVDVAKLTPQQRDALEAIFLGRAGGFFGEWRTTEEATGQR